MAIVDLLWDDEASGSVCVCFGDVLQAIYSFMGAKLETLIALAKQSVVHHLANNYRSPGYLLEVFNRYASDVLMSDQALLPAVSDQDDGASIEKPEDALVLAEAGTDEEERTTICEVLQGLAQSQEKTAVIVNANREADAISRLLDEKSVPHFKISGKDIFNYDVMKTAKAYLKILTDDYKILPWAQILFRLSKKPQVKLGDIRKYLMHFSKHGLVPSDLMLYEPDAQSGPISYLDDFCRAYSQELVVFDTETTGLSVGIDEIIQIAAVKMRAGKPIARKTWYLRTERPIPEMLGNIPNPMIAEYEKHRAEIKEPKEAIAEFFDFVGSAPLVGHNVEYDRSMIGSQFEVLMGEAAALGLRCEEALARRFDTLKLSYAMEAKIRSEAGVAKVSSHKLCDLLQMLKLSGVNTHNADDDVVATCQLAKWFFEQGRPLLTEQRDFLSQPALILMSRSLRETVYPCFKEDRSIIYDPKASDGEAILVRVLRKFIEQLPKFASLDDEIANIVEKLPVIYRYLDKVLIDKENNRTLYAQLQSYLNAVSTLGEADLCNSDVITANIIVATVHKAKGLEFDNVIISNVVDDVYPHYQSESEREILEDARKLYVALTRAKRKLMIFHHAAKLTSSGMWSKRLSRFIRPILPYFRVVSASRLA